MVNIPSTQGIFQGEYIFVRNGEKCKIHKIEWCEVGLQLADIANNIVGKN